jgi:hypothetical protein
MNMYMKAGCVSSSSMFVVIGEGSVSLGKEGPTKKT